MTQLERLLKSIAPLLGSPLQPRELDGEALWSVDGSEFLCKIGNQSTVCNLIVSKDWVFDHLSGHSSFPGNYAIYTSPYIADTRVLNAIVGAIGQTGGKILVLTDLDPIGIVQRFVCARNVTAFGSKKISCVSGGVDDAWLQLIEDNIKFDSIEPILIPLSPGEKRAVEAILKDGQVIPLLGHKCMQILSSGRKIELEAATNVDLYKEGYSEILWGMFMERAERVAPLP